MRLYHLQDNSLVVTVMPIAQQRGSADCGLFAIGTPCQAASGLSCDLKQEEVRQHLKENFDNGILTSFPTTTSGKENMHILITLYCVCSLPADYDSMMVQCEECDSWYHYRCVGIKRKPKILFVHTVH